MNKLEEIVKSAAGEHRKNLEEFVRDFAENILEKRTLQKKLDLLTHENRLLKKQLFGASSEKIKSTEVLSQSELQLFNEFELIGQELELGGESSVSGEDEAVIPPKQKKPGRKPLPAHLPRVQLEHDLTDQEKICNCGTVMECIGIQKSEELEYVPASLKVIEHHCKKYVCACCAKLKEINPAIEVTSKTAKKPPQLIEKSFASPGLLAQIVTSKFCDHLPLYRQEQIFNRLSINLSRQTMSTWMLAVGKAIIPLINLLQDHILSYDIAYADETTVQVLNEPNRRAQTKSYMWCFIGGPPDQQTIIYQYHPTRQGDTATQFFAGYTGALHCDGYTGYHPLIKTHTVIGLNCWAHVRRKFIEALPNGKEKGVAGSVVKTIRHLYCIEENLRTECADSMTIKTTRKKLSEPILVKLKTFLDEKAKTMLPQSPVGKAIAYTLKRWPYLITYLEDGRYEIDNNRTERAIKPFVCGRKNWLFSNSVDGAEASANLFSLIETAKAHSLNPVAYLTYIFKELPTCKVLEDFEALLPSHLKDEDFLKNNT